MSIHKKIVEDAKKAMLEKKELELLVLKGVKASFMNELLVKKPAKEELNDEEALAVIKRLANQRKDSIEQFTKGGRADLAKKEQAELEILELYLPKMMDEKEVRKIVEKKVKELGAEKGKTGSLMSALMKDLKGKADGAIVKKVVDEIFQ